MGLTGFEPTDLRSKYATPRCEDAVKTPDQGQQHPLMFLWGGHVEPTSLHLTKREGEVLALIGQGVTTDMDLAAKLHVSPSTVQSHVKSLLKKAGAPQSHGLDRFSDSGRLGGKWQLNHGGRVCKGGYSEPHARSLWPACDRRQRLCCGCDVSVSVATAQRRLNGG